MSAPDIATPGFEASDRHLRRHLSLQQLFFLSFGAIVGSGWLFAELGADSKAGPASILSWAIAAVLMLFIAFTYAELSAALPRSGAVVRYPHWSHGAYTGFIMGWAFFISTVTTAPIEAEAVITYLAPRFPHIPLTHVASGTRVLTWPDGFLVGIGFLIGFFFLNYFGVRLLGRVTTVFTWWKLLVPTVTFAFLFTIFHAANFHLYGGFFPFGSRGIFHAISISGIVFAYLGFRIALEFGGEARKPQRDLPLATIFSIVTAALLYIALQASFTGAIDWAKMGIHPGAWASLQASSWASNPLYSALVASGIASLGAFSYVLLIDAGISPSGTGWIYTGNTARVVYGMSIDGYFPTIFQIANRWGIPWLALVVSVVIGWLFLIPLPGWYLLVGFVTSATVLTFFMGGVGLPVLRRTAPHLRRPFVLPLAKLLAPAGFLAAVLIFFWSGWATLIQVEAATFVGLPIFVWFYAPRIGWIKYWLGWILGLAFLGAFVYMNVYGGWLLSASSSSHHPPFANFMIGFAATVILFSVVLWLVGSAACRRHVIRTAWLLFILLASLPVAYYSEFGPLSHPVFAFPYGTLIELGLGIITYYWAVASGFLTREIKAIESAQEAASAA